MERGTRGASPELMEKGRWRRGGRRRYREAERGGKRGAVGGVLWVCRKGEDLKSD